MHFSPTRLVTNRRVDPLGIGTVRPEFGWMIDSPDGQTGYQLQVARNSTFSPASLMWDSGIVLSSTPYGVLYSGAALESRTRYMWRVRIVSSHGREGEWGDPATFETGLLHVEDWSATWITNAPTPKPAPRTLYFRKEFVLDGTAAIGRAYVSALGWYRLFVNGHDVTGHALVPRWTPLDDYVEYQSYDVTPLLRSGVNVVTIVVAEGRYRGRNGPLSKPHIYGDRLATLAQLDVKLDDGRSVRWTTDTSWVVGGGRIVTSDPKFGERVDLRISDAGWIDPNASPTSVEPTYPLPGHPRALIAEEVEQVREVGQLPGRIHRSPSGSMIVDFGQNFTGVARVLLRGAEGTHVSLLYSEVLTPEGELDVVALNTANGGTARQPKDLAAARDKWWQRDEVILGSTPVEYTPWFTFHGFRYVMIDGDVEEPQPGDVEGIVLSTDLREVSEFSASDPRLEQLRSNVIWSMRSNFLDTPTDCPHRERAGWTGDIQIFAPTAAQLMDVDAYLRRYLRNLAAEQRPDGSLPPYVPSETSRIRPLSPLDRFLWMSGNSAGWGDAAIMLPWSLYLEYGDLEVLRRQYVSASAWHSRVQHRAESKRGVARRFGRRLGELERHILDSGYHYGEWLRPGESIAREMPANLLSGRPVVATAYYAHSTDLMAQIAQVLGHEDDARRYSMLAAEVKRAWRAAFVTDGGRRIGTDKQDDYVRALAFELLEPKQRPHATARLVELIDDAEGHLGTGFLSTAMLLPTLVENGRTDVAYRILVQTSMPSWLAQIEQGATTTWETWEGHDANGHAVGSHNHYAFGAVVAFLHEYVAGLRRTAPGYRQFRVDPALGGGVTAAAYALETPLGRAAVEWALEEDTISISVSVPPGAQAEVHVPGRGIETVGAGEHHFVGRALEPKKATAP